MHNHELSLSVPPASPAFGIAFMLAPWIVFVPFIFAILFIDRYIDVMLFIGLLTVLVAYVGMFFIGLPAMLLLSYFAITDWWPMTCAGALGGFAIGLCAEPAFMIISIPSGAIVAATAWLIAFQPWRREGT